MGACTGCANPQRRLKDRLRDKQLEKSKYVPPNNYITHKQTRLSQSVFQNQYFSEIKSKQLRKNDSTQEPFKSRLNSKIVKKYTKQPTLRQQQYKTQNNFIQPPTTFGKQQDKPMKRMQSLDESIIQKKFSNNKLNGKAQGRNQSFYQSDSVKQFQFFNEKTFNNSPDKKNQNVQNWQNTTQKKYRIPSNSPIYQFEQRQIIPQKYYLPKKTDKYRDKQLAEIMQTFQLEAETPGYVKQIRQMEGQDICMNNFEKFQAIPNFEWFSVGKYLQQIYEASQVSQQKQDDGKEQNNKNSSKVENDSVSKTIKKQLKIQTQQSMSNEKNKKNMIQVQ